MPDCRHPKSPQFSERLRTTSEFSFTTSERKGNRKHHLRRKQMAQKDERREISIEAKKLDRLIDLVEALVRMRIAEMLEKEMHDSNERKLFELTGKKPVKELADI